MLKDKLKRIKQAQDEKIIDHNDFWLIENNPLSKVGVFPYLGRQISPELEPDRIYQVLRPEEELSSPETLESFKLIPLVDEHTMLGTEDGMQTAEEKGVHGVTGTNVEFKDGLITDDLKIFSETLKDEIKSGKKDLSVGYYCRYDLTPGEYEGQHYDAIQRDVRVNHIALVDEGRMGKDVRVMDERITFDTLSEILQQQKENEMTVKGKRKKFAMDADVDKRELIREVMAIAAKPDSDFEGGEQEKIETIAKKLEELSYNNSEAGANDENCGEDEDDIKPVDAGIKEGEDEDPEKTAEDEDEDKRKLIDEIGGILKDKVDEELWRTIIGKVEKIAYNNSESGANDEDDTSKKEEEKPVSMDSAIKYLAKKDNLIKKLKPVIGDNAQYSSMTIPQVVKYACDKLDLKPSLDTLEGYLKAHKTSTKVTLAMDNASYDDYAPQMSNVLKEYVK